MWNQLVQNGDFSDGTTKWRSYLCTISASNNILSATIVTSGSSTQVYQNFSPSYPSNHKYLASAFVYTPRQSIMWLTIGSDNKSYVVSKTVNADTWTTISGFITPLFAPTEFSIYLDRINNLQTNDVLKFTNVQLFDLTLMFGAGNEPSTVEEFEALYPLNYYNYNAGTLINNNASAIESTGFNQWDEEWEIGIYNTKTGKKTTGVISAIRGKNPIVCLPNTEYYINVQVNSLWRVLFYDASDNYIGWLEYSNNSKSNIFTTPANARYIRMYMSSSYGTTYNHDICINLSDPAKNGTYEPYKQDTLDLSWIKDIKDSNDNQLFPNGLLSASSVYDEVTATKAIKRVGVVDLGDLTWIVGTNEFLTSGLNSLLKFPTANTGVANIICTKYTTKSYSDAKGNDKVILTTWIGAGAGLSVRIKDSDHSTAPTSSDNWLSGVILYYELATPVEIPLSTPHRLTYRANKYCTEEVLPRPIPGSSPLSSSIIADITYQNK